MSKIPTKKPSTTHRSTILSLLALSCLSLGGAALGAHPVDFTVPAAAGKGVFKLSEAKGRWVVLHFLLKTECPVCLRYTQEFQSKAASLPNTTQVFLKPDTDEEIRGWASKLPPETLEKFPIYRDADAGLAKAYGVPGGYAFHGQTVHYPALILLGPDGKEVFRYVGKNNSDRYPFEKLKEKIPAAKP
jgi:peroxiredoxin Q/BCP